MSEKVPFNLLFQCESCEKYFPVANNEGPNSLTHKKKFESNGQSIFLTYYDCPHCGKRHFVQIDDANSLQELTRVTTEFTKLAAMRKKGKSIPRKQSDKFKKSRQHLAEYRRKLMEGYTGKTVIDENGAVYTLRFSV